METLLECGIGPNALQLKRLPRSTARDHDRFSSLHIAPDMEREMSITRPQTVMGFRANVGGKSAIYSPFEDLGHDTKTALHLALELGRGVDWLEILIKKGADVNLRTGNNTTPLLLALESRQLSDETI